MDIPIIDRVFGMESGVVLNFSNRTFANFFHEEFGVDIYDDRWAAQGNSKANRLRCYLQRADRHTALQTLEVLLSPAHSDFAPAGRVGRPEVAVAPLVSLAG